MIYTNLKYVFLLFVFHMNKYNTEMLRRKIMVYWGTNLSIPLSSSFFPSLQRSVAQTHDSELHFPSRAFISSKASFSIHPALVNFAKSKNYGGQSNQINFPQSSISHAHPGWSALHSLALSSRVKHPSFPHS